MSRSFRLLSLDVGGVVLWDVAARKRLSDAPLIVKGGLVGAMAFSPDGKTIAAGYGGGVVLWDVAARKRVSDDPLTVKEGTVGSVAFSPDRKTVAAGCDFRVVLLNVDLCSWQRIAGRTANRNFTRDERRQYFPDYQPYHRTFRDLPWPSDLPEMERTQAAQKEKVVASAEEVSTRRADCPTSFPTIRGHSWCQREHP